MPLSKRKEISFREGSTRAQGVASYEPWQCSIKAKGVLTSQQASVARQLLQPSRQAEGPQEMSFLLVE